MRKAEQPPVYGKDSDGFVVCGPLTVFEKIGSEVHPRDGGGVIFKALCCMHYPVYYTVLLLYLKLGVLRSFGPIFRKRRGVAAQQPRLKKKKDELLLLLS